MTNAYSLLSRMHPKYQLQILLLFIITYWHVRRRRNVLGVRSQQREPLTHEWHHPGYQ